MSKPHGIALPRIGLVSLNVFYLLILGGCTATEQKTLDDLLNGVSQVQNQVQNQGAAVAAPTKEVCAIVNSSQALSRESYQTLTETFTTTPPRSIPESRLVELAGLPYCQLSQGNARINQFMSVGLIEPV